MIFLKQITCPENGCRALVELIAQTGKTAPYRDVRTCILQEGDRGMSCRKACLSSPAVLETPFIMMRSHRLRIYLTGFHNPPGEKKVGGK